MLKLYTLTFLVYSTIIPNEKDVTGNGQTSCLAKNSRSVYRTGAAIFVRLFCFRWRIPDQLMYVNRYQLDA